MKWALEPVEGGAGQLVLLLVLVPAEGSPVVAGRGVGGRAVGGRGVGGRLVAHGRGAVVVGGVAAAVATLALRRRRETLDNLTRIVRGLQNISPPAGAHLVLVLVTVVAEGPVAGAHGAGCAVARHRGAVSVVRRGVTLDGRAVAVHRGAVAVYRRAVSDTGRLVVVAGRAVSGDGGRISAAVALALLVLLLLLLLAEVEGSPVADAETVAHLHGRAVLRDGRAVSGLHGGEGRAVVVHHGLVGVGGGVVTHRGAVRVAQTLLAG